MTRFRCLNRDCEATCCGGGAVPVEPSTHRQLTVLAEKDPTAQQLLSDGIELTPQGPDFARLRFLPSGGCSMLDAEGLCRIHSSFGHAALFEVCASYPRYANEIDGEVELLGTLSCPEVARLALLVEDGFEQEPVELSEIPRKLRNRFVTKDPYFAPYRLIRTALTRLFGESQLALSERLFVCLWLADKLRGVLHAGCVPVTKDDLQAVLSALSGADVLRALASNYRGLRLEGELPAAVLWHALPPPIALRKGAQTEPFDRVLCEVWASIGRTQGADVPGSVGGPQQFWPRYEDARALVAPAVRARIDVCLSRYVVNHLLTTPYMLVDDLFTYAYDLVLRVAILRFLMHVRLSAFSGSAVEVDARIVETTYSFVRSVEHGDLLVHVQRQLAAQGLNGLPHALCFLAV